MGVQTITQGKVVCISFADGTVEYRDRLTMAEIYNEPASDRIMSLHQVGFSFSDPTPCKYFQRSVSEMKNMLTSIFVAIQTILSPTNSSLVQICPDGEVKWKLTQYSQGDIGNSNQDRKSLVSDGHLTFYFMVAVTDLHSELSTGTGRPRLGGGLGDILLNYL